MGQVDLGSDVDVGQSPVGLQGGDDPAVVIVQFGHLQTLCRGAFSCTG